MKFKAKVIYILLSLSIFFVFVSAIITYYNTREQKESMKMVIRRYQSIGSSEQLLSYLKDMETGERGYVITGDSEFLQPFNEAGEIISIQKDTLKKLFAHDEEQTSLLETRILSVVDKRVDDMETTIRLANKFGNDSAVARVNGKIGKAYMDTLRSLVGDLVQHEKELLAEQTKTLEKNTMIEDTVRFFALVLIGGTAIAALLALFRRQQEIRLLLSSLEKSNESLEIRVKERTNELVQANMAKDHFLGIASHDLKVPLIGVVELIRLMKSDGTKRSKIDVEYLDLMEGACSGMQDLIGNLLDINRIERGEARIEKVTVSIEELLDKLRAAFIYVADRKAITLNVIPFNGSLQTDAAALNRILENLVSNAIKYSTSGKTVEVNVHQDATSTTFEISDQGLGIPAAEQPDLFKRFHRFSNRPTGGETSNGLGLAIVKELTTLLGGEIKVFSVVGQGSRFTVTIPNK